jgi:hydrogenase expression/formation protein HypD
VSLPAALADPRAVAALVTAIDAAADRLGRAATFMEVCGTHTHAVAAAGLRQMLPPSVRLISGPGCPVCVTPVDYLDRAVALAALPATTVATFGDLMRVPSSTTSLEKARAAGHRVEVVYSPRDALDLARRQPDERVVFLAVGFETTVPTIAGALAEAEAGGVPNFLILSGNKVMPPPMRALASDPELGVDGFLLPGHVSVIVGADAFLFLADELRVSGAVVGFTPTDVLRGVLALLERLTAAEPGVVNLYGRVVTGAGNTTARAVVNRFFAPASATWRGFGVIPGSGLDLRPELAHRDASRIPVDLPPPAEPKGCRCGDVLRGAIDPPECPLFANSCTPDNPVGACMVSSEGTCAAWHRHGLAHGPEAARP